MIGKLSRSSALVLIPLLFWVGYLLTYVLQGFSSFHSISESEVDQKVGQMKFVEKQAQKILMTEDVLTLSDYLNEALALHFIDYALVKKDGKNIYANFNIKKLEKIELDNFAPENNVFITRDDTVFRTQLMNYEMFVGLKTNALDVTMELISSLKSTIILDIATVTLMVLLITWLILKDVISLSRLLEHGAISARLAHRLNSRLSFSREGETLLRSTMAFEHNLKQVKASKEKFASTTSAAVLHEILSGTALGTQFQALVVRIDLNHYTQSFVGAAKGELESFLSQFFAVSAELITRYGGFVYQYVGDEIIFHFKETEQPQTMRAFGCVRSLFDAAKNICRNMNISNEKEFTLKATIRRGGLCFHQLHIDHGFLGLPLIETARISNVVTERTRSTFTITQDLADEVKSLGHVLKGEAHAFKGLTWQITTHEFVFSTSLEVALATANWPVIKTFCSDSDFIQVIEWVRKQWRQNQIEGLRQVLLWVQKTTIVKVNSTVIDLILECVLECHQTARPTDLNNTPDYGSAMWLSLAASYLSVEKPDERLVDLFFKYLNHQDQRVQAHAVSGLSRWGQHIPNLEKKIAKAQGRLWAEVVLALARIDFNSTLLHAIVFHKQSGAAENMSRASYVAKQIIDYYQAYDPIQIESNPALRNLCAEFHSNGSTGNKSAA